VLYNYYDDNQVESIIARDITGDEPEEIYVIEYKYDGIGRKCRQTVWDSTGDSRPQYDAQYHYDNRDQLLSEKYLRYNATDERMEVWRAREYEFDNGGSMTSKKIREGDDWVRHEFTYSRGYHMLLWTYTLSDANSGNISITYDSNGNLSGHGLLSCAGALAKFDLAAVAFTYDVKNRLKTYQFGAGTTYTLWWDALDRIREKTWTIDSTNYKQVFYHDGRELVQIWNEEVDGTDVTREISYDLYRGVTGYQKDIDFDADPDVESYLVKDEQGTIRAVVEVAYSGGSYTVTTGRYVTDAYGAALDPAGTPPSDTHYMRYISSRVEGYGDPGSTENNQALIHLDHRHYLPYLGIFLQREPIIIHATKQTCRSLSYGPKKLNTYRYCYNSPSNLTDHNGLSPNEDDVENNPDYIACREKVKTDYALCKEQFDIDQAILDDCVGWIAHEVGIVQDALQLAIKRCWEDFGRGLVYFAVQVGEWIDIPQETVISGTELAICLERAYEDAKIEYDRLQYCNLVLSLQRKKAYYKRENCEMTASNEYCDCLIGAELAQECWISSGIGRVYQDSPEFIPSFMIPDGLPCCIKFDVGSFHDLSGYPEFGYGCGGCSEI